LLSKKNIELLEEGGYGYILGARPKNDSSTTLTNQTEAIKQQILAFGLTDGQSAVIRKDKKMRLIVSIFRQVVSEPVELLNNHDR
jgi:hypothetical protein